MHWSNVLNRTKIPVGNPSESARGGRKRSRRRVTKTDFANSLRVAVSRFNSCGCMHPRQMTYRLGGGRARAGESSRRSSLCAEAGQLTGRK